MSNKIVVRGGAPGMIKIEVEGTDSAIEISSATTAYDAVHKCRDFMQALYDAMPVTTRAKDHVDPLPARHEFHEVKPGSHADGERPATIRPKVGK